MNILYLFADSKAEWNCSEWRCAIPMRAINKTKEHKAEMLFISEWATRQEQSISLSEWADIIVIQRLLLVSLIPVVEHWKAKGKTVIADFDDDYQYMPRSVAAYPFWREGQMTVTKKNNIQETVTMPTPPAEQLKATWKRVHAVTAPSNNVLDRMRRYNENAYLVPNYFQTSSYVPSQELEPLIDKPAGIPVIGWGGSFSHLDSFKSSGITLAFGKLIKQGYNFRVLIAGGDQRIANAIKIPDNYKAIARWLPYEQWPRVLQGFDIGLVPLYGQYDRSRSWIKPIEYGLMGIPWVGSIMPMTEEFKDHGVLVENTPPAWARGLATVLDDYEYYKGRAEDNKEAFLEYDINKNVDKIIDTYQTIIDNAKNT